jgi:decaprenylphospho-beta-D-ribofuranose 2-oxidase
MGLTGVILRAAIRLQPGRNRLDPAGDDPTESVDAAIDVFEENLEVPYSVAWIDCIGHPPRLGRSLVMLGRHATGGVAAQTPPRTLRHARSPAAGRAVRPPRLRPECRPTCGCSTRSTMTMGAAEGRRLPDRLGPLFLPARFHPNWNRIYGRAGFYQFQCALPLDGVRPR